MEEYPQTIIEFREWFATEQTCRDYIGKLRWPAGFVCPRCQTVKAWTMKRRMFWCIQCGYQVSATAGTLFHDTHKPLRLWFEAMWYLTSQKYGVSALGLQRVLGLGYQHKVIRETPDLGDNLLPLANRVASLLKRWLLGTHQGAVQSSHLDYYLDEYTFRFNRRTSKSRGLLFYRLITQAVHLGPVLGSELSKRRQASSA